MTATPTELTSARDDALGAVRARLHAFLARRVESPEVADDLTQDVLLRLLQHQDGLVDNPTAWLYRVARNVLIDHYRTRASQRRRHTGDPTTAATVLADEPFADDPQATQRELAGCLRSLVDQLAEPYRSAVTAVDLDGQTQADAARRSGLSVSGMKSRVQRGRRQLRTLLTECCRVHTSPTGGISGYEPSPNCQGDPTAPGSRHCRSAASENSSPITLRPSGSGSVCNSEPAFAPDEGRP
jgi:RNA polymerase sigma-70 factor, ECF subfamily